MSLVVSIESTHKSNPTRAEIGVCDVDEQHLKLLARWAAANCPEVRQYLNFDAGAELQVELHRDSNVGRVLCKPSDLIASMAQESRGARFIVATFRYRVAVGGGS